MRHSCGSWHVWPPWTACRAAHLLRGSGQARLLHIAWTCAAACVQQVCRSAICFLPDQPTPCLPVHPAVLQRLCCLDRCVRFQGPPAAHSLNNELQLPFMTAKLLSAYYEIDCCAPRHDWHSRQSTSSSLSTLRTLLRHNQTLTRPPTKVPLHCAPCSLPLSLSTCCVCSFLA